MNLISWAGAARRAEFLTRIQGSSAHVDLIQYGQAYRFEHAFAADYEREKAFAPNDVQLAQMLTSRENKLY